MNKFKLLSVSSLVLLGTIVPASASTTVKIETKATQMNVTVPSTIEFIFNEDGTNTVPTNFDITNNSQIARVSLVKADLSAQTSQWRLLPESANTKLLPVDSKDIQFYLGLQGQEKLANPGTDVNSDGQTVWENGEISIDPEKTQNIAFKVNRGAFNTAQSSAKAFDMTLTFAFYQ